MRNEMGWAGGGRHSPGSTRRLLACQREGLDRYKVNLQNIIILLSSEAFKNLCFSSK